jgi:hypothetical protein
VPIGLNRYEKRKIDKTIKQRRRARPYDKPTSTCDGQDGAETIAQSGSIARNDFSKLRFSIFAKSKIAFFGDWVPSGVRPPRDQTPVPTSETGIWLNQAIFLGSHNFCFATRLRRFVKPASIEWQSAGRFGMMDGR